MPRRSEQPFILSWLAAAFLLGGISCLCPVHGFHHIISFQTQQQQRQAPSVSPWKSSLQAIKANGDNHAGGNLPNDDDQEESNNLLGQPGAASRLSHAMLQVPSVDATVKYWKETAKAQVTASSKVDPKADDNSELRSAFVVLGNGKSVDNCFALELVFSNTKTFNWEMPCPIWE